VPLGTKPSDCVQFELVGICRCILRYKCIYVSTFQVLFELSYMYMPLYVRIGTIYSSN
jgi:hypothetical protein